MLRYDMYFCVICGFDVAVVQGKLFPALRKVKLIPEDVEVSELEYSRCGRTDKGVSALGQVGYIITNAKLVQFHVQRNNQFFHCKCYTAVSGAYCALFVLGLSLLFCCCRLLH